MPSVRGVDLKRELAGARTEGMSPVRLRLRNEAIALIAAEDLVEACYSYNIVRIDERNGGVFHAGGQVIEAPRLLPESGELTALGCGVCTLGGRIDARISELFAQRKPSLAVALDEVGNEMLFALGRRIQDRMLSECYKTRLSMGTELHAGDPGLELEAQAAVLRLADADKIGVGLYRGHSITPLKSTSVVFAVGRDLPEVKWSRCESCPSVNKCNYGRRVNNATPVATLVPVLAT